jgi:RHS repeat-associated protein
LLFDAAGRLARIDAGERHIRILRHVRPGAMAGAIAEVVDETGAALRFVYETGLAGARLARIDTPFGAYVYSHDMPPAQAVGFGAWRLTGVVHPPGWRREYLYESALQGGNPYLLTGIAWRTAADAAPLRTHAWAYDARDRAILSTHGLPASARDRVEISYLATPGRDGAAGLTRVHGNAGTTDFHTAIRGGQAVLLGVNGTGCPGCAAPGLRADYDARGRLTRLNGVHLTRTASGALTGLRDTGSGWPGLSLSFALPGTPDARSGSGSGQLVAWASDATGTETRRWDNAGRVMERRYANGDVWRHAHDGDGRPIEIIMRSAAGALRTAITWRGAVPARVEHPHEHETRRHDDHGRLVARTVHRPALAMGDAAYGYREGYAWDAHGRLSRHELPEGGQLTYAYDAAGRVARIAWENGGAIHELLRALPDGGYRHGNGLRTLGLLRHGSLDTLAVDDPSTPERPPILLQRLRYDPAGRIAGETLRVDGWHAVFAYGHDADGRLAAAAATLRGASGMAGSGESRISPEPRTAREKGATEEHVFDGAMHAWRHAWRPAGDALATQEDASTRIHRTRRDASGLPTAQGNLRLQYGPDRRLASVARGRTVLARYTHNAYGERIRRRGGGRAEDYLYAFNRLAAIAGTLATGGVGITRRFVYAGWVPVAMITYPRPRPLGGGGGPAPDPVFHAIHADAIGMPRAVTDAARQVRWRALWSPTGTAIAIDGELSMPLRQPGHLHDPATGLHDNYLRTYDPQAGHYLEPDPAGPMPATQAYGYADQQPRRHIDPHGLLLFAFDGTNQDRDARTNVALMSGWYAGGTAFYHRGPGFEWPRTVDAATGGSSPSILETQWRALLREIAARNRGGTVSIDLLGYSRGAALAMHFGNMIAGRHHAGRFWTRDPAMGTVSACVDLRFMGLFDVVAQFGVLGSRNTDYNLAVSAEWRWVAHAVALNERRRLFPLSLPPEDNPNLVTAPFIGAHGDIGGGYLPRPAAPQTARPGGDLSDVALAWMLKQAERAGAAFLPPPAAFLRVDHPVLHDERGRRARRTDEDRPVLEGAGDTLMAAQGEHARYGEAARAQAEAFIRRVRDWTETDDSAVAAVDMEGYRGWLRQTLDMVVP